MSLDYDTGRRIREFIRLNMAEPLTAKQIVNRFRLRPGDETDVRDLMIETALIGVPAPRREPDVLTSPARVLGLLIFWLACPDVTSSPVRQLLMGCPCCRNHLLYLLDTAPYTDCLEAQITARLRALPEVHKAHGPAGPDQDPPQIRWITP